MSRVIQTDVIPAELRPTLILALVGQPDVAGINERIYSLTLPEAIKLHNQLGAALCTMSLREKPADA